MNISAELKQKFIERDGKKSIKMYFNTVHSAVTNDNIYLDTLKIKESLLSGDSMEFVGCISSTMEVELHGITEPLKGAFVEVVMTVEGFTEEVPIFKGYVDSVKTRLEDSWKSITCYDVLYSKASDKDVSSWYNSLRFPITIENFRDGLFATIGINQVNTQLPNDHIMIDRQFQPKQLNALACIKSVCQINGVCGIINREGKFEYRTLKTVPAEGTYPAATLFPANYVYPSELVVHPASVYSLPYYKDMEYEDFDVYNVTKVSVRDNEDSQKISYGSNGNEYIVQGNMFITGLDDSTRLIVAQNIYQNVNQFNYKPFECVSVGLPFVEVGDCVRFNIADWTGRTGQLVEKSFIILNREINGTQFLEDTYIARGEQYQKLFISDINARIDALAQKVESAVSHSEMVSYLQDNYLDQQQTVQVVDTEIAEMETPTGISVASVYSLPAARSNSTLYLVGATVVVL